MVSIMDALPPARQDGRAESVSRRRLLWLAGGAGVAAMVGGCSKSVTESATRPSPSPTGPPPSPAAAPALPPPSPTAAPAPRPTAASAVMLCRDAWGAQPARPGGRAQIITRMTLHHEAVVLGDNRNAPDHPRQDQRYHQDKLGWIDIAYHV